MKVMKHFSSNGCISFQCSIPFPVLRGYFKSGVFVCNSRVNLCKNGIMWTMRGVYMYSEASLHCLTNLRKLRNPFSSNVCLYLQYSIPFAGAKRVPQIWYFVCNLRVNIYINSTIWFIRGQYMVSEASTICFINTRKDMNHFISNEYLSLQHSIPFLVLIGYPKSGFLYTIWESTYAKMTWYDP